MSKTEILKINSCQISERRILINNTDLNKTKESFHDDKNNQNENIDNKYFNFNKDIRKEKMIKKVKFMEPSFVNIIEVESYKKFNQENTNKDPFYVTNQNDDKANVVCSCFIV